MDRTGPDQPGFGQTGVNQGENRAWRPGLGIAGQAIPGRGSSYRMDKRSPAPPLLRPPRRSGRRLLAGLALGVAGLGGGLVLGLSLRQPVTPAASTAAAPVTAVAPAPTAMSAPVQDPASQPAEQLVAEQLAGRLATLRAAVATEQARLDDILQARSQAAAEVAGLRRDLAMARRELSAPAPVSQQPGPSASPLANPPASPPASTSLRPPRAEAAAGSSQPRVFVHLRAGSSAAAETAASLAGTLREAGFDLTELRPVASTPSQRVVRYFHGEDAATAARLAGRLGRGWTIQDFRSFEPTPAPQTLEIWLPDR
ncbi:MAG: LytR cell envelope-related transcriptional attenuator [Belnapia sp.]|nr:LytR cell envelope-related transcriptional attenuator [Belnapia sp.]